MKINYSRKYTVQLTKHDGTADICAIKKKEQRGLGGAYKAATTKRKAASKALQESGGTAFPAVPYFLGWCVCVSASALIFSHQRVDKDEHVVDSDAQGQKGNGGHLFNAEAGVGIGRGQGKHMRIIGGKQIRHQHVVNKASKHKQRGRQRKM